MALELTLVPQTELDAVNQLLLSIGQSPVSTLSVAGLKTVNIARLILHNTSREVQSRGWEFNTDTEYTLSQDANGKVSIPAAALSVDPCDRNLRYVERKDDGQRRLYDKDNHTFVIGKDVKCDIVWFYEFEDLPQCARAYIAHLAGRIFQASTVGSQILYQFTKEREAETLAWLEREEGRVADTNAFRYDTISSRIFHRY